MSVESARGYMRVAGRWDELEQLWADRQRVTGTSLRQALALLAKSRSGDAPDHEDVATAATPVAEDDRRATEDPGDPETGGGDDIRSTPPTAPTGRVELIGARYEIFGTERIVPRDTASTVSTNPVTDGRVASPGTSIVPGHRDRQLLRDRILAILRDFLGEGRARRVAQADAAGTTLEELIADEIVALCIGV
jgi:hypothetical protein